MGPADFDPRAIVEIENSGIQHEVAHRFRNMGAIPIVPFIYLKLETIRADIPKSYRRWVAPVVRRRLVDHRLVE